MRRFFLILLAFAAVFEGYSQCSPGFEKGFTPLERGYGVAGTPDSGAVVTGTTGGSLCVIKTDKFGDPDWKKEYNGIMSNQEYWSDIVAHPNGKYYVTGIGDGWYADRAMLTELTPNGDYSWGKAFGLVADSTEEYYFGDLIVASNGDLVGAGRFAEKPAVVRIDTNGNIVNAAIHQGPFGVVTLTRMEIIQTADGGFAMMFNQGNQVFLTRYDANLNLLWTRFYIGNWRTQGLIEMPTGGFMLVGGGNPRFWLVRTDETGFWVWGKEFSHTGNPSPRGIANHIDGNVVIGGNISGFGSGSQSAFLMKTDTSGNILWTKAYNAGNSGNEILTMAPSADHGFLLSGCEGSFFFPDRGDLMKADMAGGMGNGCEFNVTGISDASLIAFSNTVVDSVDANIQSFIDTIPVAVVSGGDLTRCAVNIVGTPAALNLGNDTTLCLGDSLRLDGGGPTNTFVWNTGDTVPSIQVGDSGRFAVVVTDTNGCTTADEIWLGLHPELVVELGNDTASCQSSPVLLDAGNPGADFTWADSYGNVQSRPVDSTGTYWVLVIDSNGCQASDTMNYIAHLDPVVNLGNDTIICPSFSVTLDAITPGATSYLWNTGATNQTITVFTPTAYSVTVTNTNGCTGIDTLEVFNFPSPAPMFSANGDTTLCQGDTLILDAGSPGGSYFWYHGDTTQMVAVTDSGTYEVDVTDTNGCQASEAIDVFVQPLPQVDLGNDTLICAGGTFPLNPGNFATYLWQDSSTAPVFVADTSGIYWVEVADSFGCGGTDTVSLITQLLPVVNIGPDTSVCPGAGYTLNAGNPGYDYLWNDSTRNQVLLPLPPGSSSYWVEVSDSFGCTSTDTAVISFLPGPFIQLPADTVLCDGDSTQLFAGNPGYNYLWSTGSTASSIWVSQAGDYSVYISDTSACDATDTITISTGVLPTVNLGNDTAVCAGSFITLDAGNAGSTFLWSTGSVGQTLQTGTLGSYSVTVTNAGGCFASDTVEVARDSGVVAAFNFTGGGLTLNFSDLSTGSPTSWSWNFGDGTTSTLQNPSHTFTNGTYNVCLTASDACGPDVECQSVIILGSESAAEGPENGWVLFPNPANDRIFIRATGRQTGLTELVIFQSDGKLVAKKSWDFGASGDMELNLRDFAEGLYVVRIGTGAGVLNRTFTVIR